MTARRLARHGGSNRPRQADLRRAVSTAYYALFHTICWATADLLIGTNKASRSNAAWKQAYRSVDHGRAKSKCTDNSVMKKFPKDIEDFANEFATFQIKRHEADYDPTASYLRSEVLNDIRAAEAAIKKFKRAPLSDRRAFVAWLVLGKR